MLAVGFLALASACSAGYADSGPLGAPNTSGGGICILSPQKSTATYGFDVLVPTANVTIESVDVLGLRNAEYIEARILMINGTPAYGSYSGYPPDPIELAAANGDWADSVAADGAELLADHDYDLMVGLQIEKSGGGFDALRVKYTSDGKKYQLTTTYKFFVATSTDTCDVAISKAESEVGAQSG